MANTTRPSVPPSHASESEHRRQIANVVNIINQTTPDYSRTDAEIAAGVTPVDYRYPEGDVRRYGAVGDGSTDDTTAIQAAIDVALSEGAQAVVAFPPGTYKFTTLLGEASSVARHITLKALGRVTLYSTKTEPDTTNYDADYAIRLRGLFVKEVSLASDAQVNDGILTLSDVSGIDVGDLLEVKSTRLIYTDDRGNAREGQVVRVNNVSVANSRVGLDAPMEYYAPASKVESGSIDSVTSTTEFVLSGIDLPERSAKVRFVFTSGTLSGQSRYVTSWDNSSKVAKFEGSQSAWPAGASPGDTFNLVWETTVSITKPIRARITGDFHFTRDRHLGATGGDYGFRGIDILYGDAPIVQGIQISNFSETGLRFRSCFYPVMRDCTVTDANRAYDTFDGTGYGVSVNQCYAAVIDNVRTSRCRKGIDVTGAQMISWRTKIVNCDASGGGVAYVGDAFWPVGTTEQTGLGSHGGSYGTTYSNCTVTDVYLGWGIRGLEETIWNGKHRGYGRSCVRYFYGGALTIDGFVYEDRVSEIGLDDSTRYGILGDAEDRCLNFLEVFTDHRSYIQTLPLVVKNVVARKLRRACVHFYGASTDLTAYNLVVGGNMIWASPEGGTNTEFSFVRCEDTKLAYNLEDLGGNRIRFDDGDYDTFHVYDIGADMVQVPGTYYRMGDDMWLACIADDAAIKIPVAKNAKMCLLSIFDRERDRNYRAVQVLLAVNRDVDYSPLEAANKTNVELSTSELTGTTGNDDRLTIAYRPDQDMFLHIENRMGDEMRPIIVAKFIP